MASIHLAQPVLVLQLQLPLPYDQGSSFDPPSGLA